MTKTYSALTACLLTVASIGHFDLKAQTIINSGSTVQSGTVTSWPLTVQSGGTLQLNTADTGDSSKTITISGTGNGTVSNAPRGAIFSQVNSGTMGMTKGIKANLIIDGTASTLANGDNTRLRFQGNVTGGTLTAYSVGNGAETHAAYASSFNIDKLVIAKGNFTFNASNGSASTAQTHIFKNGIEVQNGGILRLWDMNKGLTLWADESKTALSSITLNTGSSFLVANTAGIISANLVAAGNVSLNLSKNLTWKAGTISSTGGTLTIGNGTLNLADGTAMNAPLVMNGGTINFEAGSSANAQMTLKNGTTNFKSGSTFSGSFVWGTEENKAPVLNLNSGATVNITENTVFNDKLGTFESLVNVAPGKRLTLTNVKPAESETAAEIHLGEGANLFVTENSTSTLNASVFLDGNAAITLDAVSSANQRKAFLTVNSIDGAGKTLTFSQANNPGGTLTAKSINVEKLVMNNSSNLVVEDLTASISFFRVNTFEIANSLTLGKDGISKSYEENTTCTLAFADGATLGLMDSVSGRVNIKNDYGKYAVNLSGTLNVDIGTGQELYWFASNIKKTGDGTARILKNGDGTLRFDSGTSYVGNLTMNDGMTIFSGGSNFNGALSWGTEEGGSPELRLGSDAVLTLTENMLFDNRLKSFGADLTIAAGKRLTLTNANPANSTYAGKIYLKEGANLFVSENSSSKLNTAVVLDGNASITLNAASANNQRKSFLTVNSVDGAGKILTFGSTAFPGGTFTAKSINVEKLIMNNSSNIVADDLTGSISLFRINDFSIGKSMTLGKDGITRTHAENAECVFRFADGATLGIMDSVAGNVNIAAPAGSYAVKLAGTLNVNLNANQELTWKNSKFEKNGTENANIVKKGEGTLNLTNISNSTLNSITLENGQTNLSGTWNLDDSLNINPEASLSPGMKTGEIGKLTANGNWENSGQIVIDFDADSIDLLAVNGNFTMLENAEIVLNWVGDDGEFPSESADYIFFEYLGNDDSFEFPNWDDVVFANETMAAYFNGIERIGNAFALTMGTNGGGGENVPEPAAWILLLLSASGLRRLRKRN
ncbi:MAG: PEP-CTERM sorting domain-containing protein [Planctomycetaceae bacterium]|nr:PEP-CTERM sorting domain-containing protein [Planctomycetaceae bacterium]